MHWKWTNDFQVSFEFNDVLSRCKIYCRLGCDQTATLRLSVLDISSDVKHWSVCSLWWFKLVSKSHGRFSIVLVGFMLCWASPLCAKLMLHCILNPLFLCVKPTLEHQAGTKFMPGALADLMDMSALCLDEVCSAGDSVVQRFRTDEWN